MVDRVLFVCLGNICRSPLAEGILRRRASEAGLDLFIDSAGTGNYHIGDPPDARAMVAAREHGFEISALRARKIRTHDFSAFEMILVADRQNLAEVMRIAPEGENTIVEMMTKFSSDPARVNSDVPDPYYSGQFDPVIALLEDCIAGLIAHLKEEQDRSAADA